MREQIEDTWLPHCLKIDISYDLFWKLNPRKIKSFEKTYKEKTIFKQQEKMEFINYQSWLNGIYVAKAISACFSKEHSYPIKPIDMKQSDEIFSNEDNAENFKAFAEAFNEKFRQGKRGELDGS